MLANEHFGPSTRPCSLFWPQPVAGAHRSWSTWPQRGSQKPGHIKTHTSSTRPSRRVCVSVVFGKNYNLEIYLFRRNIIKIFFFNKLHLLNLPKDLGKFLFGKCIVLSIVSGFLVITKTLWNLWQSFVSRFTWKFLQTGEVCSGDHRISPSSPRSPSPFKIFLLLCVCVLVLIRFDLSFVFAYWKFSLTLCVGNDCAFLIAFLLWFLAVSGFFLWFFV